MSVRIPETIEPRRLERALMLGVVRQGPQQYAVQGQQQRVYHVALDRDPPCDCADAFYRGSAPCKHEMAARLVERDPVVLTAIGDLLLRRDKWRQGEK